MSDAYAAPGPWAAGSAHRAHRGPHQHGNHQERRQERSDRRGERIEALRAVMALKAAMASDEDDDVRPEDLRRGRRGGPRGRGRSFGPGFGGPPGGRGRGRARRGDVRAAILVLLAEEPRNGYGVIQEIEERSGGVWKPSPGAVYPALQQLEDETLVEPVEVEGRKLFALTAAGRTYVDENLAEAPAPWASVAAETGTGYRDAKHQFAQIWHAYAAVLQDGTPEQVAAASKILSDARRSLYRLLAEDDDASVGPKE